MAPYVFIWFQEKKFNSGGKHALLRHANTLVHKRIADGRKNRLDRQRPLAARSVAVDVNDNTGGEEGGRRKEGEVEGDSRKEGEVERDSRKEGEGRTGQLRSVTAALLRTPMNCNDQATKACSECPSFYCTRESVCR